MSEATLLLQRWQSGDDGALAALTEMVYQDLRARAGYLVSGKRGELVLNPTELVNESFLKLAATARPNWQDRAHFLAIAGRVMRQILLDQYRYNNAAKRAHSDVTLVTAHLSDEQPTQFEDLEDALQALAAIDPNLAEVVELKFFAGMSNEEVARYREQSESTVKRQWRAARAWLLDHLSEQTRRLD